MEFGFLIKKLISAFAMPLTANILLLAIAIFMLWFNKSKNIGKWIASFSIITLYLISFSPFSNLLLEPIEKTYPAYQATDKKIKYIIVLGHRSKNDPQLPLSSQLSYVTINRLVEGISIYHQHKGSKLIFSGWSNLKYGSHPERVKKMAIALGVPKQDIIIVNGPKDTYSEAIAIKPIVENQFFVLVSSASHMKRAMSLFIAQGLNPVPAPTHFRVKSQNGISFFPSPFAIEKTQFAVHEYLGLVWSKILGQ